MNHMIKRAIFAILIIINCIVIFNFSAQDSKKSTATSDVVVDRVVNTITTVNKKAKRESLKDWVTFCVRKSAHFIVYTSLGVWLMCLVNTFSISTKKRILICVIIGMVYATSDEIHQYFVGGRSAEIRDVCIDTCGVLFGIVIAICIGKLIREIGRKVSKTE